MKMRMRVLEPREVERAKYDGKLCLLVAPPGWMHDDEMFTNWAILEQWDEHKGAWVEIPIEL